jgi:hypothetical protein
MWLENYIQDVIKDIEFLNEVLEKYLKQSYTPERRGDV